MVVIETGPSHTCAESDHPDLREGRGRVRGGWSRS